MNTSKNLPDSNATKEQELEALLLSVERYPKGSSREEKELAAAVRELQEANRVLREENAEMRAQVDYHRRVADSRRKLQARLYDQYDKRLRELAAAQKRIAELEEHYRSMVSLVQSPNGFTCTEPGNYALNVKVFEDGSGLVQCIEKMRPDQDCYPSLEWQEFHHVVKRLEKAEAERDALRAQVEAKDKALRDAIDAMKDARVSLRELECFSQRMYDSLPGSWLDLDVSIAHCEAALTPKPSADTPAPAKEEQK